MCPTRQITVKTVHSAGGPVYKNTEQDARHTGNTSWNSLSATEGIWEQQVHAEESLLIMKQIETKELRIKVWE